MIYFVLICFEVFPFQYILLISTLGFYTLYHSFISQQNNLVKIQRNEIDNFSQNSEDI
jgi:hypothetical protein